MKLTPGVKRRAGEARSKNVNHHAMINSYLYANDKFTALRSVTSQKVKKRKKCKFWTFSIRQQPNETKRNEDQIQFEIFFHKSKKTLTRKSLFVTFQGFFLPGNFLDQSSNPFASEKISVRFFSPHHSLCVARWLWLLKTFLMKGIQDYRDYWITVQGCPN